jgi:hypothetical protein
MNESIFRTSSKIGLTGTVNPDGWLEWWTAARPNARICAAAAAEFLVEGVSAYDQTVRRRVTLNSANPASHSSDPGGGE